MQTLLPTSNDLAPKRFDKLHQPLDIARWISRTDRSSFTQLMKRAQRIEPSRAAAGEARENRDRVRGAVRDAIRDSVASKETSRDQAALLRKERSNHEPTARPQAPSEERSRRPDSIERSAQNDDVDAQDLPADSAVTDEVNVDQAPVQSTNPGTIEPDLLPYDRTVAAGEERSNASAPTIESTPGTSLAVEASRAPASNPATVDGAAIQTSTPTPNGVAVASPIGVVDDLRQLENDRQATAGSSSSGTTAENQVLEPTTGSTQPPAKTADQGVTVLPSPGSDESGSRQVLVPPPSLGERGAANHDARPLDIDRAPQNEGRLQSPASSSQSETSQDSPNNDRQSQSYSNQGERSSASAEPTSHAPASARAVQIDAAVRVENATGQPVPVQSAVSLPAEPLSPTNTAGTLAKEAPTPNTPTRSADPTNDPFTARIVRGLSATLNQRGGVLTMRLDPPQLGQLRIQMTISKGTVSAAFQTSTPQAQALLERSMAALRSALQGHGLTVERLTVQTTPQSNAQVMRQDSPEHETQQGRQHSDAGKGESRGRRDGDESGSFRRTMSRPTTEYATFDVAPQPAGAD